MRGAPDAALVARRYDRSVAFKTRLGLYDTVRKNENFFIGRQWEGVDAHGLPTPVFNFLKRVVLFQVATVTSDNIAMQASPLAATGQRSLGDIDGIADVVNKQFQAIFERNQLVGLLREFLRNAAVDGDGCLYTWFDPSVENGQPVRGEIVTEVVENTRVHFGNPYSRDVQTQPWILLSRRMDLEEARELARDGGDDLRPDAPETFAADDADDRRVTVLTYLYRDRETGTIRRYLCTRSRELQPDADTGLTRYPLVWLNWDYVQDCCHGQALVTGLLPNQIFINKLFAMSMISLMTTAYPKIVYDKTRIPRWDSRVGAAIGVNGGDMNSVARIIDPAQISPQIAQFIQLAVDYTQSFLGASDVALGNARPENTSAIVALQRAAGVPLEITKQNLYRAVEQLGRIYLDHMRNYYGVRTVQVSMDLGRRAAPLGIALPEGTFQRPFDFSVLGEIPLSIQLDVGASSYWSEIASQQTLDNLLVQNKIDLADYLERIPTGYITKKQELIEKLRGNRAPAAPVPAAETELPLPAGGGNGALQRAIAQTATA